MAIQNFLSGGFYGKLGDVVGQRWHNKRIVRSYVIPQNPQTEKQQANRQLFKIATALAQEAYNINKGSHLWDTSQVGQFSQMVSLAKRRLQAGMSQAQALPLYPEGYTPSVILSNPSLIVSNPPNQVNLSVPSYTFTETRRMQILITLKNEETNEIVIKNYTRTVNAGTSLSFTYTRGIYESFPEGSSIQAFSLNDEDFHGLSITLPPVSFVQPSVPSYTLNINFLAPTTNPIDNTVVISTSRFARFFINPFPFTIRAFDTNANDWATFEAFLVDTNSTYSQLRLPRNAGYSYPSGSRVEAGPFVLDVGTFIFTFTWNQVNINFP